MKLRLLLFAVGLLALVSVVGAQEDYVPRVSSGGGGSGNVSGSSLTSGDIILGAGSGNIQAEGTTDVPFHGANFTFDHNGATTDNVSNILFKNNEAASGDFYIQHGVGDSATFNGYDNGRTVTDLVTTSSSAVVTSATAFFNAGDKGRTLTESGNAHVASSTSISSIPKTTIASGSNNATLPQSTINVASTTSFATAPIVQVMTGTLPTEAYQIVTCTGKTSTTLTGCTGGTGTMLTGNPVWSRNSAVMSQNSASAGTGITAAIGGRNDSSINIGFNVANTHSGDSTLDIAWEDSYTTASGVRQLEHHWNAYSEDGTYLGRPFSLEVMSYDYGSHKSVNQVVAHFFLNSLDFGDRNNGTDIRFTSNPTTGSTDTTGGQLQFSGASTISFAGDRVGDSSTQVDFISRSGNNLLGLNSSNQGRLFGGYNTGIIFADQNPFDADFVLGWGKAMNPSPFNNGATHDPRMRYHEATASFQFTNNWATSDAASYVNFVGDTLSQTLTNKTISGSSNTLSNIGNASLTNSSISIAGTSTALGGSITLDTIDNGIAANGLITRTAANTRAARTVTGTANQVTVTNGDGVSGNPTLSIPSSAQLSIAKNTLLTTNGFVKTGSSDGSLSVDTNSYLNLTGGTMTGTITSTIGSISSSTPALSATETWNSGGTTFTGIKENITNTASASGSLLIDLQVGGGSVFNVGLNGAMRIGYDGSNATTITPNSDGSANIYASNAASRINLGGSLKNGQTGTIFQNYHGAEFQRSTAADNEAILGVYDNTATNAGNPLLLVRNQNGTAFAAYAAGAYGARAVTFANAHASPFEGEQQSFTDSTTATWGATITGGGSNHVLGRWNGSAWTVVGK